MDTKYNKTYRKIRNNYVPHEYRDDSWEALVTYLWGSAVVTTALLIIIIIMGVSR